MKSGYYETAEKLVLSLNKAVKMCGIKRLKGKKMFTYDSVQQKFSIDQIKDNYLTVIIKGFSISLLGLDVKSENDSKHFVIVGKSKLKKYYYFKGEKRYFNNNSLRWRSDSGFGGTAPYIPVLNFLDSISVDCDLLSPYIFGNAYCQILKTFEVNHTDGPRQIVKEFNFPVYHELKTRSIHSIRIISRDSFGKPVKFSQGKIVVHLHFIEC